MTEILVLSMELDSFLESRICGGPTLLEELWTPVVGIQSYNQS
jgi:hypothetical protein